MPNNYSVENRYLPKSSSPNFNSDDSNMATTHVLLFPFHSSGHIIPILDLADKLLSRNFTITILVAPSNLPLLQPLQSVYSPDILRSLVLPFPEVSPPSLPATIRASSQLREPILEWFRSQPSPPVAIVSDFFLGWTHNLATHDLGIPRILFWPSAALPSLIIYDMWRNLQKFIDTTDQNSLISFSNIPNSPSIPLWQVAEFPRQFVKGNPDWEFLRESLLVNSESWGVMFNSFAELEGNWIDRVKTEMNHDRVWVVGPLLPKTDDNNRGGPSALPPHQVTTWLNDKASGSVLYVCFGSRSILTSQQAGAIAAALDRSGVNFIWRGDELIPEGYENRVANRGLILKGWAPQVSILRHRAVGAFLTHCGWNSTLEGIASGVLMLTWPLDADQFLNARMLVDELGVAIKACEGGTRTVPDPEELAGIFVESVRNDHPKKTTAKKLKEAASKAVESGGSSSKDMDALIKQLNMLRCS